VLREKGDLKSLWQFFSSFLLLLLLIITINNNYYCYFFLKNFIRYDAPSVWLFCFFLPYDEGVCVIFLGVCSCSSVCVCVFLSVM
jgi:hypothetical protein